MLDSISYISDYEKILNDDKKFSTRSQLYSKRREKYPLWSQAAKNKEIIDKATYKNIKLLGSRRDI